MKNIRLKNALVLALVGALLLGCNKEDQKTAAQQVQDPMIVAPSPELLAQLKLDDVKSRPLVETLRVAGRIDFDEHRLARIGATITGRVTEIDAWLGQDVKKGDVLARLNSSELSEQQLAYLKARAQLELNRRNAERAKALFEADVDRCRRTAASRERIQDIPGRNAGSGRPVATARRQPGRYRAPGQDG